MSEAAKIKSKIEKYLGEDKRIIDIAAGDNGKIVPHAIGVDGRAVPGVDVVSEHAGDFALFGDLMIHFGGDDDCIPDFDVVFSSHFLEHLADQYGAIETWRSLLKDAGLLILYLPDGRYYDNKENPEHLIDMNYDDFIFWFRRAWCGEGKDFKGEHLPKYFELVEHGLDVGEDRYSFYVVAKKV